MHENADILLQRATQLHLQNRFQEAHDHYVAVLQVDPENYHATHLLGVLLLQNGFSAQGREHLERAVAMQPQRSEAQRNAAIFGDSVTFKVQAETETLTAQETYQVFDNTTVDSWRHNRMLDFVPCIGNPNDRWLTVGDAHGYDSIRLRNMGITQIVASNLNASVLSQAHALGHVGEYMAINAEQIPLENSSFDYVLCKEALHHMPRPMQAIYEMLRVARKGIVFVEPQDKLIDWPVRKHTDYYRELVAADEIGEKVSFRRTQDDFEIVSSYIDWWEDHAFNYVYTLSKREIRKMALGMGLPSYATKNFNDFYQPDWALQAVPDSEGFRNTVQQIDLHDSACAITGKPYSYITGMMFKQSPDPEIIGRLVQQGYEYRITPTRYLPIVWPKLN